MKRLFDFIASFFGLILLIPIFVIVALWIKLDSKGGVFFRQERVGFQGALFRIHKFRTMVSYFELCNYISVDLCALWFSHDRRQLS